MNAKAENQIDCVELPIINLNATKTFCEIVFGWKFEDYGPDYTSFFDGRIAGRFHCGNTCAS